MTVTGHNGGSTGVAIERGAPPPRELGRPKRRYGTVHGAQGRGLQYWPEAPLYQGRFGRLFGELPALELSEAEAADVAARMVEPAAEPAAEDNPAIPSGFTYLGQFIDHDITFDPASSLQKRNDPEALVNFRTPAFDLDSLYGRGPDDQPYMYDWADGREGRFLLGRGQRGDEFDLPRNAPPDIVPDPDADEFSRALIGDPRNDENILVNQLHTTMLLFHNRVMDHLQGGAQNGDPGALELEKLATKLQGKPWKDHFLVARDVVRWHYQWVVINDFLRRIVGDAMLDAVLERAPSRYDGGMTVCKPRLEHYRPRYQAFMPVEFSVAAYRFGHSMIRNLYRLNSLVGRDPRVTIFRRDAPTTGFERLSHLGGFRRLPGLWTIEWRFFFEVGELADGEERNHSRKLDTHIAFELSRLPDNVATGIIALAQRNLMRGSAMGLPSGQEVAGALGVEPLSAAELGLEGRAAPLWYYVLKEAEVLNGGLRLGPVGGTIVAETFVGMLQADRSSWLRCRPGWRPFLGRDHEFTMADLITFTDYGLKKIGR